MNSIKQFLVIGLVLINFSLILVDSWYISEHNRTAEFAWSHRSHQSDHRQNRIKREEPDVKLAFSTLTAIRAFSLQGFEPSTFKDGNKISFVHSESKYIIKSFDLSYFDNLVVFGLDTIYASNIRGEANYLSIYEKTDLNIKFELEFAVDWKDHNLYAYSNKQIFIYLFRQHSFYNIVYNSSQSIRNFMVDYQCDIICWIDNDNSIIKAQKDGQKMVTVRTEKTPIHAMTSDWDTLRFFYITTKTITKEKVTKQSKTLVYHYYGLVYSVDHEGQFPPELEGSFKLAGAKTNITHLVKHFDSLFFVMVDEIITGDKVYQLCHLNTVDKTKEHTVLYQSVNFELTSIRKVDPRFEKSKLCDKGRCPYLCIHIDKQTVRCVCRFGASNCDPNPVTPAPDRRKPSKKAEEQKPPGFDFSFILYILVAVCVGLLIYLAYVYFYEKDEEEEEEEVEEKENLSVEGSTGEASGGKEAALPVEEPSTINSTTVAFSELSKTAATTNNDIASKFDQVSSNLSTASLHSDPIKGPAVNNAITEVKTKENPKAKKLKKKKLKSLAESSLKEPTSILKKASAVAAKSNLPKSSLGEEDDGNEPEPDIIDKMIDWAEKAYDWMANLFNKINPFKKDEETPEVADDPAASNASGELPQKNQYLQPSIKSNKMGSLFAKLRKKKNQSFRKKDKSNKEWSRKMTNYVIDRKSAIILDDNPNSFIPIDPTVPSSLQKKTKSRSKSRSKNGKHRKRKYATTPTTKTCIIDNFGSERKNAIILNNVPGSFTPIDPYKDSVDSSMTKPSTATTSQDSSRPSKSRRKTTKTRSSSIASDTAAKTPSGSKNPETDTTTPESSTDPDTSKTPSVSPKIRKTHRKKTPKSPTDSTKPDSNTKTQSESTKPETEAKTPVCSTDPDTAAKIPSSPKNPEKDSTTPASSTDPDTSKTSSVSPKTKKTRKKTPKTPTGSTKPETDAQTPTSSTTPDATDKTPSGSPKIKKTHSKTAKTPPADSTKSDNADKTTASSAKPDIVTKSPSGSPKIRKARLKSTKTSPTTTTTTNSPSKIVSTSSKSQQLSLASTITESSKDNKNDKSESGNKTSLATKTTTSAFVTVPSALKVVLTEPFDTSESSLEPPGHPKTDTKGEIRKNSVSNHKKRQKKKATNSKSRSKDKRSKRRRASSVQSQLSVKSVIAADPTVRSSSPNAK